MVITVISVAAAVIAGGVYRTYVRSKSILLRLPGWLCRISENSRRVERKSLSSSPDADLLEASLVEPLSCVVNGQSYLNIGFGENVLVIGQDPLAACMWSWLETEEQEDILADISQERLLAK